MRKSFRNRNNNRNRIMIILIALLFVSLGYAAISTTLKINGTASVKKINWSIYWDNPVVTAGSKINTPPSIGQDQGEQVNTKATWSVSLDIPGDFYEFTIDAVNNGTIDAAISEINVTKSNLPDYILFSMTYENGQDVEVGHILSKKSGNTPTVEKYKVRVEYDRAAATAETINNVSVGGDDYEFTVSITYGFTDENSITKEEAEDANILYAIYTGVDGEGDCSNNKSPHCEIWDTLLTNFATASEDVTDKYFGGPTDDYRKLRLEYKRYKGTSTYDSSDIAYDHDKRNLIGHYLEIISFDRKIRYNPKLFYGFKIDSNRVIQKKYICVLYNGKKTCFEIAKEDYYSSETMGETKDVIWNKLVKMYGEYDDSEHVGCWEDSSYIRCLSPDKTHYVEYEYEYSSEMIKISIKDTKNKAYYCYGGVRIAGPNDIESPENSSCYYSEFDDGLIIN